MKKIKVISSNFNEETGVSTVTIRTSLGEFTGEAILHPEDAPSRFRGCRLAELRADVKYLKAYRKQFRNELNGLHKLMGRMSSYRNYNHNSIEAISVRKAIEETEHQIGKLTIQIVRYQQEINEMKNYDENKFLKHVEFLRKKEATRQEALERQNNNE